MLSRNWSKVYIGQKIILDILSNVENIFLAGGTAIQCYLLPQKRRESEDLDFFIDHELSSKELATLSRKMIKLLSEDTRIANIRHICTEDGAHRLFCTIVGMDELIKVELLNFTADRLGDVTYISHVDFPRIENYYNLLLYKLKAFCDRTDTIKDIFDIYFIFKELEPIEIKKLFLDLELKFLETTGYSYTIENVVNALTIPRRWDIILIKDEVNHLSMKKAIENFQYYFTSVLLDVDMDVLDFSYKRYLKEKVIEFDCQNADNYLSFYEKNAFVEYECRKYLN